MIAVVITTSISVIATINNTTQRTKVKDHTTLHKKTYKLLEKILFGIDHHRGNLEKLIQEKPDEVDFNIAAIHLRGLSLRSLTRSLLSSIGNEKLIDKSPEHVAICGDMYCVIAEKYFEWEEKVTLLTASSGKD